MVIELQQHIPNIKTFGNSANNWRRDRFAIWIKPTNAKWCTNFFHPNLNIQTQMVIKLICRMYNTKKKRTHTKLRFRIRFRFWNFDATAKIFPFHCSNSFFCTNSVCTDFAYPKFICTNVAVKLLLVFWFVCWFVWTKYPWCSHTTCLNEKLCF